MGHGCDDDIGFCVDGHSVKRQLQACPKSLLFLNISRVFFLPSVNFQQNLALKYLLPISFRLTRWRFMHVVVQYRLLRSP